MKPKNTVTTLDAFKHVLPDGWGITVLEESDKGWACQLSHKDRSLMCHGASPHEAVANTIRMMQELS